MKTPGSGRKKGTPNKRTQDLMKICEEEGIDPFRAMIQTALMIEEPKAQFDAYERICQYLYPKRKAIEVTGEEGQGIKVTIEDFTGSK